MTAAILEVLSDGTGAPTDYGYDLSVQLGIGRASETGAWDNAHWDANVWAQTDTSLGDWVDVTCETASPFSLTAGSNDSDGVVTRWEAATCQLTLIGAQWDPWGGPWAGILGPQVAVRVLARPTGGDWFPVFTGAVASDGYEWEPGDRPTARVAATDPTQVLAAADGPERAAVGQGETAAARVNRILDAAGWPAALRHVTPGGVTVKSTTLADAAWPMLLQVADTDLALLWFSRDGQLSYIPEGRVGEGTHVDVRLVMCPPAPPPPNVGPTASFTHTETGLTTSVDGSGSTDPDGTITSYAWAFGDGGTGSGVTASHTYATAGTRTVTLTVRDDDGAQATTTRQVTVTAPPLTPADLSGVFWLAAEDCGPAGTPVATWLDRKPAHHNAVADGAAAQVSTTTVTPLGGPVVGTWDTPMHVPSVTMTGSGELWAVVRAHAGDAPCWGYGTCGDTCFFPFQDGKHYEDFGINTRYSYTPTLSPLSWRLLRMALDDTAHTLTIWIDGVQQFRQTGVTTGWATNLAVFGNWKGYTAELFLRPVVSTTVEATDLQNYFWTRHQVGAPAAVSRDLTLTRDEAEPNEVQYQNLTGGQPTVVRNIVSVSRQKNEGDPEPATVTVRDEGSISRYLPRPYQRTDLIHAQDAWSTTVANAILASGAWPSMAPRNAELHSRVDPQSPGLLLQLEPSMTFDVEDTGGRVWREAVVGWQVTVGRREVHGNVVLDDVSRWVAGKWDTAAWDDARWGFTVLPV